MAISSGAGPSGRPSGSLEGQPGAAAAVLENIGRGWSVRPR